MVMVIFFLTTFSLKSSYFHKMLYYCENKYSREKKIFKNEQSLYGIYLYSAH